jgi:hypothetical protein
MNETLKIFLLTISAALACLGCRSSSEVGHPGPIEAQIPYEDKPRPSEAQIREKIVGTWTSIGDKPYQMTFETDGTFVSALGYSNPQVTWAISDSVVVLGHNHSFIVTNSFDVFHILRVDEHVPLIKRGISIAGPPEHFVR